VSGYGRQDYLRDDGALPRVNARHIRESVDKSLARLRTDHIDLLQARMLGVCGWVGGWVQDLPYDTEFFFLKEGSPYPKPEAKFRHWRLRRRGGQK
jgi:hypothetical protein